MKIKQVTYNDDEVLETLTVTMSLREAAAIHALAGKLNGYAERRLKLTKDDNLFGAIANVFNGHWETGYPPDAPGDIFLGELNDPPES